MAAQALEGLTFEDEQREYILKVLDPVLEEMVSQVVRDMPLDPVDYMIRFLRRKSGLPSPKRPSLLASQTLLHPQELVGGGTGGSTSSRAVAPAIRATSDAVGYPVGRIGLERKVTFDIENESEEDEDDDEDDDDDDDGAWSAPFAQRRARSWSVSAEVYGTWNQKQIFEPPCYPKSEEQRQRLRRTLMKSILFQALEDQDVDITLLALREVTFEKGARIISEGDDGDHLFIVEEGNPVCKKRIDGDDKVVKQCGPGDVFGELALLYNGPRAATVDATDRCLCWQLDRETFNHIVKEAASKRQEQYGDFLKQVGLFGNMDDYERAQVLDTLKSEVFREGDFIVKQGEPGDKFYILEHGSLVAQKEIEGKPPNTVKCYGPGDYFGELALLRNQPRAASIAVTSATAKVLSLDRKSFTKMLGPLEEMLSRGADKYS